MSEVDGVVVDDVVDGVVGVVLFDGVFRLWCWFDCEVLCWQILEVVVWFYGVGGYDVVMMCVVVKEVGMLVMLFYCYFFNKVVLFEYVWFGVLDDVLGVVCRRNEVDKSLVSCF